VRREKCEIVIVKYGLPDLEAECVASLEQTTGVDFSITAHDNYDADEHLSKVWNDLIRSSPAEYICLLNNDTRIEQADWLNKLLECFDDDPKTGAAGPMTNKTSGIQGKSKIRTRHKNIRRIKRGSLTGFCMLFPKSVWEEAGGFDEEFALYGEDSDFCMMLCKLGYNLAVRTDAFVFHHGASSTPVASARGKDIKRLQKLAAERYQRKWHNRK
jgi:GT2 family glycosyltransferase